MKPTIWWITRVLPTPRKSLSSSTDWAKLSINTHVISSLYKTFPAEKARSIAKKLDIHYTPKHGSWLNIAEIAISILSRQCINRRIPTLDLLNSEIVAWEHEHNNSPKHINWQFSNDDARVKLSRIYPSLWLWCDTTVVYTFSKYPDIFSTVSIFAHLMLVLSIISRGGTYNYE